MMEALKKTGYLMLALVLGALYLVLLICVFLPKWLWETWLSEAQRLRYPHCGMYAGMARYRKENHKDEN